MKYLYLFLVIICLVACSTKTTPVVVPASTFSINFNGYSYNEVSDASHPIVVGIDNKRTDKYDGYAISVASVSLNTKNIKTLFSGQNSNTAASTGNYYLGIRDAVDSLECPYFLIDKGHGNTIYAMDTFSTFNITEYNDHQITGFFNIDLWSLPSIVIWEQIIAPGDTNFYSINLNNLQFDTLISGAGNGFFKVKPFNVPYYDTSWVRDTLVPGNLVKATGKFTYNGFYGSH